MAEIRHMTDGRAEVLGGIMEDRKNSSNRYDNERPIPKRRGRKPDKAKGSRRKKSSVWKVILASLILCLLAAAGTGAYILKGIIDQAPDITALSLRPDGFATTIYDSAGNETERLVMEGTNREEASYEEFPEDLVNAFIAIEDERFWTKPSSSSKMRCSRAAWRHRLRTGWSGKSRNSIWRSGSIKWWIKRPS